MNRDYRDFCTICGYYFVGLAQDCKCTGDERGGSMVSEYEVNALTKMLRNTDRWFKEFVDGLFNDFNDPTIVSGKYAKTPCAICGKKGEDHTHIGNYKPEGYKPSYMIRIWRWLNIERTITRWQYWMMGIGSGITASALTTFVHWLGS